MELCKLCQVRPADKANTHYLTDGVIRSCLNEEGANGREKAMAFNISLDEKSIEARFQRNTSQKSIQETFGREASEEEIEEAKKTMFSVDYVFYTECEKKFTAIETPFLQCVLPNLRGKDFTGQQELSLNSDLVRAFFLLQVYRTTICDPSYKLSDEKPEKLRRYFSNAEAHINELKSIPLHVTYLSTLGGNREFTTNTVGIAGQNNNRTILFNDFIIQTSSDDKEINFLNFHGLNGGDLLKDFTNLNEESFRMRVFWNEQRKNLFRSYHLEKAGVFKANYWAEFDRRYYSAYGILADPAYMEEFLNAIIHREEVNDESKYSAAHFEKMMSIYLDKFRPA